MSLPPILRGELQALRGSKIRGVQLAIVVDNKDGDGNPGYRVKLKLPWLSGQDTTFWARIAIPMGGADRGTYVLPEVDDQVLVVFEHGDINRPIVVGALWSRKQQPVEVNQSGQNHTKLIKSRSGHRIIFDDKDGAEKVTIVDKTRKNKIVLDSASKLIKIESDGDIEINAKTNVIMHANALKIGAKQGVSGKGQSLLSHAQKTFGLKATSGITIGGGNTTINVSNAAATKVSGSGSGELGGAASAKAPEGGGAGGGGSGGDGASTAGGGSTGSTGGDAATARGAASQNTQLPASADPGSPQSTLTAAAWGTAGGDTFAGDAIQLTAKAQELAGTPVFEIHAAADDRVVATVSGTLAGTTVAAQWTTPSDFHEAAANDPARAPRPIELYFVVKLGGQQARSGALALHPLRHLNLKLIGAPPGRTSFVVTTSGGAQRIAATDQLDAILRTTDPSCTIDFGRGPIEVVFEMPPLSEDRGVRLRLGSLGYQVGGDDNPYAPSFVRAVVQFQADAGLELSGRVDGDTRSVLQQRFGF